MARLNIAPPAGGPTAEVWITLAWNGALVAFLLAAAWLVMLALDFVLLPRVYDGWWKRPWCWLFGHIDGEDFEVTADGFFDKCTRCTRLAPTDED